MVNPGFSALVSNDLGAEMTPADGFDSLLAQVLNDASAGLTALSAFNLLFTAMDYSADPVQSPQWGAAVNSFVGINSKADSQFAATAGVLGSPTGTYTQTTTTQPVQSPVTTAPVHGGGGGGGSSSGGGSVLMTPIAFPTASGLAGGTVIYTAPPSHQPMRVL